MASQDASPAKFDRAMKQIYKYDLNSSSPWTVPPCSAGHRGRYLWTDAFGVVNFLTLYRQTESDRYLEYAKSLVDAVHNSLGRTRDGKSFLPGASPDNPMGGGLRIGKEEESGPDEDGQYHHYLTLWMFALNRLSIATTDRSYNNQAIALAKAIHPRFVYNRGSNRPRMYWKMSMDLSEPLVRSEGNLDPMDGYVVFRLLQSTGGDSQMLANEIGEYEKIVRTKWQGYSSTDPLDLGMSLWTVHWFSGEEWADGILESAVRDLKRLFKLGGFEGPQQRRLAFRDFGTCLGIECSTTGTAWRSRAKSITDSWEHGGLVPVRSDNAVSVGMNAEDELTPINTVMYAAALIPGAFKRDFF
ncbi:hypothetical protein P152DRAFT_484690 [Eremomyces bilateralis CBS 781.70]|uniref:Six-hairpin glycosidase n=1 Tax=Eremomyces bilateralis CBS 781.70 TaxID=1392243 RepID=A0A6G1FUJ0_9PEZI|nr:uncharacterized protein P152DRAFT_484690 [Eremomyces bilateralis CBS 781.70]KAF1809376.1 hypothetical protein P152DRAFT_484690 [Eremomyces bilateralis CBS 781.70]